MKIALIDDEPEELDSLFHIITKYVPYSDLHAKPIDTFLSGTDFFAFWKTGMYDLIFLDIYLKDCLGIDIARKVRESDKDVLLVFCTASNEFASESYEVGAHNYLQKPFSEEKAAKLFKQLKQKIHDPSYAITLPDGQSLILRNIIYTEYYNHVVIFYNKKGSSCQTRISQGELEHLLCQYPFFCCCSKGMIVNFYEAESYHKDYFVMSNQKRVPVSRRKSKHVQDAYARFRFEQIRQEVLE